MESVCRTCLRIIGCNYPITHLNHVERDSESVSVRQKLQACVPELTVDIVVDPTICGTCTMALVLAYQFRSTCLESEKTLYKFILRRQTTANCTDLLSNQDLLSIATRNITDEHSYAFTDFAGDNCVTDSDSDCEPGSVKLPSKVQSSLTAFVEQVSESKGVSPKKASDDHIQTPKEDKKSVELAKQSPASPKQAALPTPKESPPQVTKSTRRSVTFLSRKTVVKSKPSKDKRQNAPKGILRVKLKAGKNVKVAKVVDRKSESDVVKNSTPIGETAAALKKSEKSIRKYKAKKRKGRSDIVMNKITVLESVKASPEPIKISADKRTRVLRENKTPERTYQNSKQKQCTASPKTPTKAAGKSPAKMPVEEDFSKGFSAESISPVKAVIADLINRLDDRINFYSAHSHCPEDTEKPTRTAQANLKIQEKNSSRRKQASPKKKCISSSDSPLKTVSSPRPSGKLPSKENSSKSDSNSVKNDNVENSKKRHIDVTLQAEERPSSKRRSSKIETAKSEQTNDSHSHTESTQTPVKENSPETSVSYNANSATKTNHVSETTELAIQQNENIDSLNHQWDSNENKRYQCSKCSKAYEYKSHFDTHLKSHIFKKLYLCPVCEKSFTQEKYLKSHALLHTTTGFYQCDICLKYLSAATALKRHLRTHTGEKPYPCTVCNKRFAQKVQLAVHMRTHTGVRPFSCNVCNANFTQKSHLMGHMRIHTGEKPYKCDQCTKCFRKKYALRIHLHSHSQKPFQCKSCNHLFRDRASFDKHINKYAMACVPGLSVSNSRKQRYRQHRRILNELEQDVKEINTGIKISRQMKNGNSSDTEADAPACLYRCRICKKGFSSKFSRNRHAMKFHSKG